MSDQAEAIRQWREETGVVTLTDEYLAELVEVPETTRWRRLMVRIGLRKPRMVPRYETLMVVQRAMARAQKRVAEQIIRNLTRPNALFEAVRKRREGDGR